jgi:hypothetical protein
MSTQNPDQPKSAGQIVAEARKSVPEVTVTQAKEELDQGQVGLLSGTRGIFQERSWPHVACSSGMPTRQPPMPSQRSRRNGMPGSSCNAHPVGAQC